MALSSPSPTTEAFATARRDLARYQPSSTLLPAIGFRLSQRAAIRSRMGPKGEAAPSGPLLEAGTELRAGALSCEDLLERSLRAVSRFGAATRGVVTLLEAEARRDAQRLDSELAAGHWRGPLHGIPMTVKDNIDVAGAPTGAGSSAYGRVAEVDAEAVRQLREAGAVIVAKVATHELALGVTTPQARHPLDGDRIPGGSSGGSGISVATGMALASVGTDTRASIRVPAALCGVIGFKPTYGAVPAEGIVWLSWTMDHVGILAASVADAACVVCLAAAP